MGSVKEACLAEEEGNLDLALSMWKELAESRNSEYCFLRYARVARELEKWQEAEDAYSRAIAPESALTFIAMGILWTHRTDRDERESYEAAKECFLRAIAIEKGAIAFTLLGAVYVELEDVTSAQEAFEEALRLDSGYEEAMYNLAELRRESRPDEAIRLHERAIEIDPDYRLAHQALGKLRHKRGDLAKAEHHFRRCVEIDPKDYFSILYLANCLGVQGRDIEAEREYENAIALDPTPEGSGRFYANFLDSIGKHEIAAELRMMTKRRWH
jgi:tetratricopeptide (TPR) repeat protein